MSFPESDHSYWWTIRCPTPWGVGCTIASILKSFLGDGEQEREQRIAPPLPCPRILEDNSFLGDGTKKQIVFYAQQRGRTLNLSAVLLK